MLYLVYISFGFLGMQLCNALLNFIFQQRIGPAPGERHTSLSVLIPARNEASNIGPLLEALRKIEYRNLEILVCDDASTDETAALVRECMEKDERITLFSSDPLPKGWLGKNFACFQLAQRAKGDYWVFVDADVVLIGEVLPDAVAFAKKHRLGLLSVFPKQLQLSAGEKCTVPIMHYILLTLLPLIFVRVSPFASHSAANGQFMLFDAQTYKKWQPHRRMKESRVEDIAIAKYYKSNRIRMACIVGEERILCRMYASYKEALNGFSKNIFMFFGNVPLLAFLFWMGAFAGAIPVMLYGGPWGWVYLCGIVSVQLLYARTAKQRIGETLLFFPAHLFFLFHVMVTAFIQQKKKQYTWKGRNIYL